MMPSIGIIGGGQLGKMLIHAAKKIDQSMQVAIYDASLDACAREESDSFTFGSFEDEKLLQHFAQSVDIVTYEFENISPDVVATLPNALQGSKALKVLQNRILEKEFINSLPGIKSIPYTVVEKNFMYPFPFIVKTTTLGYDGKGQHIIRGDEDLHHVHLHMIAETYLENLKEYSMIIARNKNGKLTHYPTFENVHVNQILDTTNFANIDKNLEEQMFHKAKEIAQALDYYGVLTVEFFYADNQLYVNEVAPRVHNSGHITLDAANVSQFDLHIYSLIGMEYPQIEVDRSWCMVNVLGQHYNAIKKSSIPGIFYDYRKNSTQYNRKVGHINGLLKNREQLKEVRNR